jgi:hypothetical protein
MAYSKLFVALLLIVSGTGIALIGLLDGLNEPPPDLVSLRGTWHGPCAIHGVRGKLALQFDDGGVGSFVFRDDSGKARESGRLTYCAKAPGTFTLRLGGGKPMTGQWGGESWCLLRDVGNIHFSR